MARDQRDNTPAQKFAPLSGDVTFLFVRILGFIPGITLNHDQLEFARDESDAELLDLRN